MRRAVRIACGALTAFAAVAVLILAAPQADESLSSITLNGEINASSAESAPQQTVVNGWTANDLLTYIAQQQDGYLAQQNLLLALILVALGVAIAIGIAPKHKAPQVETPNGAPYAPAQQERYVPQTGTPLQAPPPSPPIQ